MKRRTHRKLRFAWEEFCGRLAVEIGRITSNSAKTSQWLADYEGPIRYYHRRGKTPGWVANWIVQQDAKAAGSPLVRMTEDTWREMFEPVKNHLDPKAQYDGCSFDLSAQENEYVRQMASQSPRRVWTVLDTDGKLRLGDGWHFVNRMSYFITRYPCPPGWQIDLPW